MVDPHAPSLSDPSQQPSFGQSSGIASPILDLKAMMSGMSPLKDMSACFATGQVQGVQLAPGTMVSNNAPGTGPAPGQGVGIS
jgi:hypothetical protein